jgi:hypothetical protein
MNAHDIYREAIKRVFANLYGVSPDEVDVGWSSDSDAIIVRCSDKTFTHEILSDDNDATLEFVVRLKDEELRRLERAI